MKKYIYGLFVIVSLAMITMLPVKGYARWVLYDNFDSGYIDSELWDIDSSSANISVENGEARFDHFNWLYNDSSWLQFTHPERIAAVRVTVRVSNPCPGDVRARIGGYLGKDDDGKYFWQHIQVKNEYNTIDSWIGALLPGQDLSAYQLFHSEFRKPIDIINKDFTIEMYFDRKIIEFKAFGLGSIIFMPRQRILTTDNFFKGIGTRNYSYDPAGEDCICTVYFDDVYVIYKKAWWWCEGGRR
jgi:hypothetical protein